MKQSHSGKTEQGVANLHRKEFDLLPCSKQITIRPVRLDQLAETADFAIEHLPELNFEGISYIEAAVKHDPTQVQLFYQGGRLVGLYAMLFLDRSGHETLVNGQFDGSKPDLKLLAHPTDRPSAIYTWFVACPGRPVAGFGNVAEFLRGARFSRADLYARPASDAGHRLMLGIGYRPVTSDPNGLHRYVRLANRHTIQEKAA